LDVVFLHLLYTLEMMIFISISIFHEVRTIPFSQCLYKCLIGLAKNNEFVVVIRILLKRLDQPFL